MPNDNLIPGEFKVGTKQSTKLIETGKAKEVFVAKDADSHIKTKVTQLCKKMGVKVTYVDSMKKLGRSCGIEVGAAIVATTNEE